MSSAESVFFPLHHALMLSPAGGSKLSRGPWPGPAPSSLPFPLCKASEELGLDAPGELQRTEHVTFYKLVKKMAWKCQVLGSRLRAPCIPVPSALSPKAGFPTCLAGLSHQPPEEEKIQDTPLPGDRLTARLGRQ